MTTKPRTSSGRLDSIARRAPVNKRMLYRYFGDKAGLYREVFSTKLAEKTSTARGNPADPSEAMRYWFESLVADPDWVRLLVWESVTPAPRPDVDDRQRKELYGASLEWLLEAQRAGLVDPELDPELTMLALIALNTFPLAFPAVTAALAGRPPEDPLFVERWGEFGEKLLPRLRPV